MSIAITKAADDELDDWNRHVERSPHANPFHRLGSLRTLADHANADLHPLVGYKGQEPVGIFPIFEIERLGISTVFSPPPDLLVPYLGPALCNVEKLKQRKRERRHEKFIDGCFEWLDRACEPRYVHVNTDPRYDDLRPLGWNGLEATPNYSYRVDLTPGADALLKGFSSDARSNVKNGTPENCTIEEGGESAIRRIVTQVNRRYEAQDEYYAVTPGFVIDLRERLPEGCVRTYGCRVDGRFVGGMITLEDGDTIYRWQGGAKHDADVPANDLVDWHVMRDAIERDIEGYDLVGANSRRLNGYKAKFNPELLTYHQAERAGPAMELAREAYLRLR
ncbi:GNAT family N-acetyltransferase [Halococcus agarilyticus]|uniref:GNAT family N-acetyltransferase n=1 Tax=Halococcus agarilyticus TaxID=1232219 RepID=UPI0006783237|nr:GNAT family N-acetyltransferase [Halococcus agarilyticus]